MPRFVSLTPVKVTVPEAPDEYILIKPKLSADERSALQDVLLHVDATEGDSAMRFGAYLKALKDAAVVGWRVFARDDEDAIIRDANGQPVLVPFAPEMLARFDEDDPLVDAALGEIARRNPLARARSTRSGSTTSEPSTKCGGEAGDPPSPAVVTVTSSPSWSEPDGPCKSSDPNPPTS